MSDSDPTRPTRIPPARIFRLGDPESEDLSDTTTVEERLEMVAVLSRRMWELTGKPTPTYERSEMPIRVVRRP